MPQAKPLGLPMRTSPLVAYRLKTVMQSHQGLVLQSDHEGEKVNP